MEKDRKECCDVKKSEQHIKSQISCQSEFQQLVDAENSQEKEGKKFSEYSEIENNYCKSKTKTGNYAERSLCTHSIQDTLFNLRSKSCNAESMGNIKTARCTAQMLSLLQELEVRKLMPLHEASDYFFLDKKMYQKSHIRKEKSISRSLKLDFLTMKMVCQ